MLDKFQGLPAHPLIVHIPIVFGPIAGLFAILLLFPRLRGPLLLPTAIMAVVFALGAILAAGSGEELRSHLQDFDEIHDHAELGEMTRNIAILFAIAMVGAWVATRRELTKWVVPLLGIGAILGALSIVWTVRTGHAGAKQAWDDVPGITAPALPPGQGEGEQ